jgi:hypothetical protein
MLLRTARPPILQNTLSNPSIPVPADVAQRFAHCDKGSVVASRRALYPPVFGLNWRRSQLSKPPWHPSLDGAGHFPACKTIWEYGMDEGG